MKHDDETDTKNTAPSFSNGFVSVAKWGIVVTSVAGVLWWPQRMQKPEDGQNENANAAALSTPSARPPLREGFYQLAGKPALLWGDKDKSFAVAGLGVGNCIKVVDGNAANDLARVVVPPPGRLGKARRGYIDRDNLTPAPNCPS